MITQRINKRQALLVAITTITGAVFQPIFRDLMFLTGNGAWVAIIFSIVFSGAVFWLVLKLAARFPRQSAAEYLPIIWGRVVGYPLVIVLLLGFFLKAVFILRHISEFFVTAVLPETPISAIMLVLLTLIVAGLHSELEGIVRFNELVLPVIVFAFALVFVGSIPRFSGWEMLPLFSKGYHGLLQAFEISSSYLMNVTMVLFIYPLLVDKDGISREASRTLGISGGLLLAIYLNIVLSLGRLGQAFTWPYLAVVENIQAGVERGESLFMVVWMLAGFITISLFIYVFALGISQMIPSANRRWVGLGSLPVAAYIALMPDNLPTAVVDHLLLNRYSLYAFVAIPLGSLLLAVLRKQRGEALA